MARTAEQIAEGYRLYRGRCKELCEERLKTDPSLRLVRGHVFVHLWPSDPRQAHWWLEKQDGTIVDPSWQQFPFQEAPSKEHYDEFDGTVQCSNCGKEGQENDFSFESNYAFCSHHCHGQFVGIY